MRVKWIPKFCFKVEGERPMMLLLCVNAHFLGMEVCKNILRTREVCRRYPQEVWDDGLKAHNHTDGIEHEAIE